MIINAACAMTDWETTAVAPGRLANICNAKGARYVHISSDAVFGHGTEDYDETRTPLPTTVYGAAKAAAEVGVFAAMADAVVVRTSWILGDGASWFEGFVHDLAVGKISGLLFNDDLRRPVHVADLAAAVLELAAMPVYESFRGVLHVAGSDTMSRYGLGQLIAERDGLDPETLPQGSKASISQNGARVLLDSSRAGDLLSVKLRGAKSFMA